MTTLDVPSRVRLVREDWQARESIDTIQMQLLQLVEFLNRFHASTTTRMAMLNGKMELLERRLRHVEASVRDQRPEN